MELHALRIFCRVAELASFTRAADQLGLPKGRVSVAVRQLEAEIGTQLLQRTTRTVRLTQDGERFFARGQDLLAEADAVQSLFQQAPETLVGRLRMDMTPSIARLVVIPQLPAFLARHPRLEVELSTTDRRVDLVQEGFDCVLRVGTLQDSALVGRTLGLLPQCNLASPAYLREHGTPRTLADLDGHRLVHFSPTLGAPPVGWEYVENRRRCTRPMRGPVTVNSADAYQAACLAGLGLIQAPAIGVQALLERGELVEVMPAFVAPPMPVTLLFAHRRNPSKRLQALIAWLAGLLAPHLVDSNKDSVFATK